MNQHDFDGKRDTALVRRCHRPLALFLLSAGLAACTFDPGQHFGTLTPSFTATYQGPPERQVAEGWYKLANEYQIQITGGTVEVGEIALIGAADPGGEQTFDPARPPPGYSLCHNGHCHSDDGRLVPYEEIAAELGGGAAGPRTVVTLSGAPALDLLAPAPSPLACEPGCGLSRTHLVAAAAPVRRLVLEGAVRDGLPAPRFAGTRLFTLAVAAGGDGGAPLPAVEVELDLPVDRDHDPNIRLDLALILGPSLFDGVDFLALGPAGESVRLDLGAFPTIVAQILTTLGEGRFFTAAISR